jgi:lipopolysaccharide transport system ATP-binding protein
MSDTAIQVEGLGKRYQIAQSRGVNSSKLLQTELVERVKGLFTHRKSRPKTTDFWALKDVSLEVPQGEILGLIGHNGAGKSTLLKILSRITDPTTGRAELNGCVGSMLQVGTGFHPELTGRENIFLNGAILGMRRREIVRKFDEIVEFADIAEFLDTPVKRYSSGMYVRLAFSVAAHLEPEILLIDEVLAVGDAAFRRKCLGRMDEVAKGGRTIIFVSHNMAAIENICHRVALLERGELRTIGSPSEAIELYLKGAGDGTIELAARADREGNGAIRITGMDIREHGGQSLDAVQSGQDVEVRLHYETASGWKKPVTIQLECRTHFNVPVFVHNNELSGDALEGIPEKGAFVVYIPRLPLPPATYRLGFSLVSQHEQIDGISDAGQLVVVAGDYYETGRIPSGQEASCLVDGRWRVEET